MSFDQEERNREDANSGRIIAWMILGFLLSIVAVIIMILI